MIPPIIDRIPIIIMKAAATLFVLLLFVGSIHAEVVLNFGDPEDFTDFEYAQIRRTIETEFFSKNILGRLEKAVEKSFPDGVVLTLDFEEQEMGSKIDALRTPVFLRNDLRFMVLI